MKIPRAILAIAVSVTAASASTIIYTSASDFEAAITTEHDITFSAPFSESLGTVYSQDGLTFDVAGSCVTACLPSGSLSFFTAASGPEDTGGYSETSLFSGTYGPSELNISFAPTLAIGVFFGDAAGYNGTGASVVLSDGTVYTFTAGQRMFIGAVSDSTYLTSFDIIAPHDFGLATPEILYGTPEPGTALLLALGLLAGAIYSGRCRTSSTLPRSSAFAKYPIPRYLRKSRA
jgi:hypothetical protein